MYLKLKSTGELVEVLDLPALFDPFRAEVPGRTQVGEELGDPEVFGKPGLAFPSDEELPRCWTDGKYREKELAGP